MFEVGRLCVKIAGRDANKTCVVVEALADGYVLIDGETRRKKCNVKHLEPLDKVIELKKGASHADVVKAFDKLGMKLSGEKKPKKAAEKPKRIKAKKVAPQKEK